MSDITNKLRQIWAIITGHTLGENVTAFDDLIQNWWSVYRGNPSWLDYSYATLSGNKQKRTRKEMNAAKIVCSELAGLCFTETPELTTDKDITDFLNREHFWEHMTEYAEYGAALGGFAQVLCGRYRPAHRLRYCRLLRSSVMEQRKNYRGGLYFKMHDGKRTER